MRILICGDRNWDDQKTMNEVFFQFSKKFGKSVVIIEGEARGADTMARRLAERYGFEVLPFHAEWEKYGLAAGPLRNKRMINEGKPNLVLAFHNNLSESKGTKNTITQAEKADITYTVIRSSTNIKVRLTKVFGEIL